MSDLKPEDYSCEILLEKTTPEKAKDTSFPTDAYNVTYTVDGEDRLDVCRAQKAANIFDLAAMHSLHGCMSLHDPAPAAPSYTRGGAHHTDQVVRFHPWEVSF